MPAATKETSPLNPTLLGGLPRLIPRKRPSPPQNPLQAPETPPLPPPPNPSTFNFSIPTRRILTPHDLSLFHASPTYNILLSFAFTLSDSAASKKISSVPLDPLTTHPTITFLLQTLTSIETILATTPPQTTTDQGPSSSRFGNPAFRTFHSTLTSQTPTWHTTTTTLPLPPPAIPEITTYLNHSFGSPSRLDYGSGHELNFLTYLLTLHQLSLLPPPTFPFLTLHIFPTYIRLLRKIQSTYYLEPAGSHGVWGLDDYQFLPFLFGASQLKSHPYIRPLSIHNELVLEEEGDEYLYLDMVRFTTGSKSVKGLKWTQPMLDDVSGAKSWAKVEGGMRRMFVAEVLGKLPVMQHFLFGGVVAAVEGMGGEGEGGEGGEEVGVDGEGEGVGGHVHVRDGNTWGDCCGIKIPSTVAAAVEEGRKTGEGGGMLRRIPFD